MVERNESPFSMPNSDEVLQLSTIDIMKDEVRLIFSIYYTLLQILDASFFNLFRKVTEFLNITMKALRATTALFASV